VQVYDVEITLFNGDLPEPKYVKILRGLTNFVLEYNSEVDCLLLIKSMYGLVQAARQ
jgi:hypothetical protein